MSQQGDGGTFASSGLASAGISAGIQLVGSLIGNRQRRKEQDRAFEKNLELMRYQNEYNNPKNQMQRLKAAGLNPHLVYGKNAVGNMAAQTPKYQAADQRFETGLTQESAVGALEAHQAIKLSEAAEDKVRTDIINTKVRTANEAIKGLRQNFELNRDHKLEPYQLEISKENARKAGIDADNAIKLGLRYDDGRLKDTEAIANMKKQRGLIAAQISLTNTNAGHKAHLLEAMKNSVWPDSPQALKTMYAVAKRLGLTIEELKAAWEQSWNDKGFNKNDKRGNPPTDEDGNPKWGNKK